MKMPYSKTYLQISIAIHILGEYEVHVNDKLSLLPTQVKIQASNTMEFRAHPWMMNSSHIIVSVESFLGQLKSELTISILLSTW